MIPYETVRQHLERRHWASTTGFSWEELVAIHEAAHNASVYHRDTPPPTRPVLHPVMVDVPTGNLL